jgi:hypothetical protein
VDPERKTRTILEHLGEESTAQNFGPINDQGAWRKYYNHELYNLYKGPVIVASIKSQRLRWAGHVARMGDERFTTFPQSFYSCSNKFTNAKQQFYLYFALSLDIFIILTLPAKM